MKTVLGIFGGVLLGIMFLAVPVWKFLHLCMMIARRCWRHEKWTDLSAFSTGDLFIGDGSCTRQCLFAGSCNRHRREEEGPTREEINKLKQILKDYENKSKSRD